MNYSAVLFDMDGTLLDTLEDIAISMNLVLEKNGFPAHPINRYREYVGDGIEMLVRRTLPEEKIEDIIIKDFASRMKEEYSKQWDKNTKLYPGIDILLNDLCERGIRLSILSNKPDDFTKVMFSRFLSEWDFEFVLGVREGFPTKPDPASAIKITQGMSLSPAKFIYLGDTNTDMKTAVAAGMFPIGVLWGFRDADELLKSGAKMLLEKPEDLFEILGGK